MSDTINQGCWVEVRPEADIPAMFRSGPTRGRVQSIDGDTAEVWVPVGDADVDDHSQAVPYALADLVPVSAGSDGEDR